MTRIATIHHPLGQVDACSGDIGVAVQVGDFAHGAAMDSHSDLNLRIWL